MPLAQPLDVLFDVSKGNTKDEGLACHHEICLSRVGAGTDTKNGVTSLSKALQFPIHLNMASVNTCLVTGVSSAQNSAGHTVDDIC